MSTPPPPPGFVLDGDMPPPPPGFEIDAAGGKPDVVGVVDGDTLDLNNGRHLRLYGVDAPESKQQGWDRQGRPIPIGQNAAEAMKVISRSGGEIGQERGQSYGRIVAPVVTPNGEDYGAAMLKQGQALAVPSFMAGEPERQFQYMQDERIARQNRLGVHGVYAQTPADFRHNPMPTPDRETVARFWDTPTPWAGLRKEDETKLLDLIYSDAPMDQVAEYAKQAGGTLETKSADAARAYFKKTGQRPGLEYGQRPKMLTDTGEGRVGAAARGFANGVLPNWLEETGAVADMLGGTAGRENIWNSDRRLADIWANNEAQNEAITGFDRQAYPYTTGASEIAGGLVLPLGKVNSAADLAKFGAGYGLLAGAGQEGSIPERLTSGVVGAGEGLAMTVLGGKALEAAAPYLAKGWRLMRGKSGPELVPPAQGAGAAPEARTPDITPAQPVAADTAEGRPIWDLPDAERNVILRDAEKAQEPFLYDDTLGDWRNETAAEMADRHAEIDARYAADRVQSGADIPPPPDSVTLDQPAQAMDGEPGASVSQEVRRPDYLFSPRASRMDAPLSDAQLRAADIQPGDVVPRPSNEVQSLTEAQNIEKGRYGPAKVPNERGELTRGTVRAWNGAEVPKVGPTDLVGWLRLRGGLADQGGDLSHMGLTNAARKGMDFVGQESRFGPLVNDTNGMNLDDAALRAWEAGYFPDHAERPTTREFLDAVRDTYEGRNRRFLPEDLAEIDRFHATQAERHALETQRFETGGDIWRDRSTSADGGQPFPPVEAYEEWGGSAPKRAGNINLENLNTPQDITRALSEVHDRVGGFDAATRGRITQAETERLASELGMTPDSLLARRKGQAFNAEEALAARQILAKSANELVNAAKRVKAMENPGDDVLAEFQRKLARHVAIQEQVSGMTAEAGRALQQFRAMADSKSVRGDVLKAIVDRNGGPGRLREAADTLLDAVEGDPGKFNVVADKLTKPRWVDKLTELRYFMLLSGPQTHAANIISNTMTALGQFPEHTAAAGIGLARRAVMGADKASDRVYGSEIGSRAFGFLEGVQEGWKQFLRTLRTGETSDFAGKMEAPTQPAWGGIAGSVIRAPMRALSAEDEMFKAMARHMELNGLAARQAAKEGLSGEAAAKRIAEIKANPPDDMLEKAFDYARYITFQRPLTGIPQSVSTATQKHPLLKFIVPFVRTPTNLLKFAVERSPMAPLLKEWRADVSAGGARRDLALAKAAVGTGFGLWMADLATKGIITGSAPSDDNKARVMRADGWQPYSVRVGDTYYSYSRLDPFSSTIGIAADLATKADGMTPRQLDEYSGLLVASVLKSMGDKTWLSGASDFFNMLTDPQRYGPTYLRQQAASSVVPAAAAQLARTIDPERRASNSVLDEITARTPGLSQSLPAERDVWGQPITTERLGPDYLSPVVTSRRENDPVNQELLRLGVTVSKPAKDRIVNGRRVKFTPQEYEAISAQAGRTAHDDINTLISYPGWKSLTPEAQRKAIQKVLTVARKEARSTVAPTPAAVLPPPPPGFIIEGEAGGRNVFADLQKLIPGIRPTSGFRTKAYQEDMKRRGYHPADNSGHLDGASLDLLPPPGKSLDWLKAQVRKYDPSARLLNEGDHLHATFPGYYGAPAIGGAAAAGLRNPNAGMPAPPPGFKLD